MYVTQRRRIAHDTLLIWVFKGAIPSRKCSIKALDKIKKLCFDRNDMPSKK